MRYKIRAVGYAYLAAHYTILFHNQGGYYNILILQALELFPGCEMTHSLFLGLVGQTKRHQTAAL